MGSSRIIPASQVVKGSAAHEPADHPNIFKLLAPEKSKPLKNPRSKIPRLVFPLKGQDSSRWVESPYVGSHYRPPDLRTPFTVHRFGKHRLGVHAMLKKFLLGSTLLVGGGALLAGTSAFSYVKTGYHSVRDSIKEQIPIEVEIKRARDMIADLKPEIAENLKQIAREEVEVSKLQREVSGKQSSLNKSKDSILKLKDDVQSGAKFVTYKGKKYDIEHVRKDLTDRFKHHQALEATSNKLEKILEARERNLVGARRKLDEMLSAKRELEVQVENLQARLTMVEVAQTGSQFAVNDSALSGVRQVIDEISTRIDVAEKLVQCFDEVGSVPVGDDSETENIVDQISEYFTAPAQGGSSRDLNRLAEIDDMSSLVNQP